MGWVCFLVFFFLSFILLGWVWRSLVANLDPQGGSGECFTTFFIL